MTATNQLTQEILASLSERGHLACRNNSGVATFKGRAVRFGVGPIGGGGGDIIGCASDGVFFSVEIKVGKDRSSDKQIKWERWVKKRGGRAGIARSVEEAVMIAEG